MPASFTKSFARRLDQSCAAKVEEAYDGAPLDPGRVYLAPGGDAHLQVTGSSKLSCRLVPSDLVSGHRPSVDVMFSSVAERCGSRATAALLTGMGRDGAERIEKNSRCRRTHNWTE